MPSLGMRRLSSIASIPSLIMSSPEGAGPPTLAEGELRITTQLVAFDDTGAIGDLLEIEQVLVPLLPGVSAATAATYVEA